MEESNGRSKLITLVAEENGSVVGMAQGHVDWSRLSTLGFLGVDESHRRKGIARSLVKSFIEESKKRDAAKITLYTSPTLKPAVKLYADMGFIPEGFLSRHRLGVDLIVYSMFLE
jgi:ribosomal protein S18 acetylase RimI-like enzyme